MNTPPGAKNAFGEPLEPDEKNVREEFLLGLGFHRYRPSRSLARRTASRGSETPLRSLSAIAGRHLGNSRHVGDRSGSINKLLL